MDTSHFSTFLPVACAGFGLLLAGGANLLLLRKGFAIRALATLGALGVGVGGAYSLNQPGAVLATAKILGLAVAGCLLLGWGGLTNRLAGAVASLRSPAVRFGLVTVCGVGTVTGAVAYFQWADEQSLNDSTAYLEMIHGRTPCVPSATKATTDQGSGIILKEATPREEVDFLAVEERLLKESRLDEQVMRRGPASDNANCHGWVFTGGRFHLSPDDVELILKENGYQEVHQAQPGDVVIYRDGSGGSISHTAVARYVTEGQPVLVEGKWGNLGIFLHPADKSTYGTDYTFYRSSRNGHLLAGLGGPATGTATQPLVTE